MEPNFRVMQGTDVGKNENDGREKGGNSIKNRIKCLKIASLWAINASSTCLSQQFTLGEKSWIPRVAQYAQYVPLK